MQSLGDDATSEDCYRHALDVARRQSAKFWELRVANDLARLWRDQGKRDEARDSPGSGLRLVHRRVRHARSERGQGVAGGVGTRIGHFQRLPSTGYDAPQPTGGRDEEAVNRQKDDVAMADQSRHKSMDTLRGYVRDAASRSFSSFL
jgi:hypothetical protein